MKLHPIICMLSADDYGVISQYTSVQEAAEDTLTSIEDIYASLAEGRAINGYIWNRQYTSKSTRKSSYRKSVVQYDLDGNVVNTFDSVAQALKLTGITNIDKAARGEIQLAGGYIWQYKSNIKEV